MKVLLRSYPLDRLDRVARATVLRRSDTSLAPSSLGWDHTLYVRALGLAPDGTVLTLGIGDLSWLR